MNHLQTLLTIIATASAAGFFIWKIFAGWLVVNLEISIETERQTQSDTEDLLGFKIQLKKGSTDTLKIKDIRARVCEQIDGDALHELTFPEIEKLNTNEMHIISWKKPFAGRKITLSPGESFHLGRFVRIPVGIPVIIEAAVHGTRTAWGFGFQWRASIASLPVKRSI